MSTMPWWGSGLFTLGGTLFGAVATLSLGLLNRRTERRRLARAEKLDAYPELVDAASQLAATSIWPADTDPRQLLRTVETLVSRIAFLGPAPVSATLGPVLARARDLANTVVRIRTDSVPGHRDQVDQRLAPQHDAATLRLTEAITAFATAARTDLEINTPFTPVITHGNGTDTISDDEPGAGSREPGAGSREPGAGSREPGAGSR